jgi:uncharacterized membrane protein YdbT with pleckstrin-like domain
MGYIDKSLISGESLVYHTRLHWNVLLRPVMWGVILCGAGGVILVTHYAPVLAWVLIPSGLGIVLFAYTNYFSSEFGVTNKRVLIKTGFMGTRSFEILLARVEGIGVDQTLWQKMWNYGTIVISGTGGSKETFSQIKGPFEFRKQVQEQIAATLETRRT